MKPTSEKALKFSETELTEKEAKDMLDALGSSYDEWQKAWEGSFREGYTKREEDLREWLKQKVRDVYTNDNIMGEFAVEFEEFVNEALLALLRKEEK